MSICFACANLPDRVKEPALKLNSINTAKTTPSSRPKIEITEESFNVLPLKVLAIRTGFTISQWSNWFRGNKQISRTSLNKAAEALGITSARLKELIDCRCSATQKIARTGRNYTPGQYQALRNRKIISVFPQKKSSLA